ncbi:hypothetical protein [Nocardia flavorosea]|uniref:hypothetical protein n=1 Tax=Nocardia flavorosea TaxID=53429 RepID=UPI0007A47887|nr:hypothetical protein [Nocardia flavorosea]
MTEPGTGLAERQAALVRALVADGTVPPGFDPAAVQATAEALLRKRARETAAHYPALVHATGPDFTARYVDWARGHPKAGIVTDALAFARDNGVQWPPEPQPAGRRTALLSRFRSVLSNFRSS